MAYRQPIISVLGHVDHGKTTLLDKIRKSTITDQEAGEITQHLGASEIPLQTIKNTCKDSLKNREVKIPGLLFLDSPGHEAFSTLRRRGGSIADLGVLVVDINEGFKPQTDESLTFLKEFKTPFVIAATKIDKISGWIKNEDTCFMDSYKKQNQKVKKKVDNKIYELMGELSERDYNSNRFDNIKDFKKSVGIVPVSGITGEGISELLMVLIGLSQRFLQEKIEIKSDIGLGNVLEVKELRGMGTTIDVILYDGEIRKGDYLVIGGKEPKVTKIRCLLKPNPLGELRTEKRFNRMDEVQAASGIKIAAPDLEDVIPGSPIRTTSDEEDLEYLKGELRKEVQEVEFEGEGSGVEIKADTLGSLEAMIKVLKENDIPIRKAKVGDVTKRDVMEQKTVEDPFEKVIFAFNVDIPGEVEKLIEDIKVFKDPVIYRLIEDYRDWRKERKEQLKREKLEEVTRPGKLRFLPELVFRSRKPAIIGVEILEGVIKPGYTLVKEGKIMGSVEKVQKEGENVSMAEKGDKVAISIDGPTVGRQIEEGDVFYNAMSREEVRKLEDLKEYLNKDEIKLLEEIKDKI
ncbi:MAG: translation initiation factor IF-2 [Candidatus Aenigmatarchaeota archaeon]